MVNKFTTLYEVRDSRDLAVAKDAMAQAQTIEEWTTAVVSMIGKPSYDRYEAVEYSPRTGRAIAFDWVDGKEQTEIEIYNHPSFLKKYPIPDIVQEKLREIQNDDDAYYFDLAGKKYQMQGVWHLDQDNRMVKASVKIKLFQLKLV